MKLRLLLLLTLLGSACYADSIPMHKVKTDYKLKVSRYFSFNSTDINYTLEIISDSVDICPTRIVWVWDDGKYGSAAASHEETVDSCTIRHFRASRFYEKGQHSFHVEVWMDVPDPSVGQDMHFRIVNTKPVDIEIGLKPGN